MKVYGEIIEIKSTVTMCRDKKDNFLLELAKDGQADYASGRWGAWTMRR